MTDFANLPLRSDEGNLLAVIETPRGSAVKYEFEPRLQVFTVSKFLALGLVYAFDFGFFPSTKAEDGDPLDVLIICDAGTFAGLVMEVRLIGVLATEQTEAGETIRNDRLIAVPIGYWGGRHLVDCRDLDAGLRSEIENFMRSTDELEPKTLEFLGWKGPRTAEKLLRRAAQRYLGPESVAEN